MQRPGATVQNYVVDATFQTQPITYLILELYHNESL
jgi:hypothetical protein